MSVLELLRDSGEQLVDKTGFVKPNRKVGLIEIEDLHDRFVGVRRSPIIDELLSRFDGTVTRFGHDGIMYGTLPDGKRVKLSITVDETTGDITRSFVFIKSPSLKGFEHHREHMENALSIIETKDFGLFAEAHDDFVVDRFHEVNGEILPTRVSKQSGHRSFEPHDFNYFEHAVDAVPFDRGIHAGMIAVAGY